MALVALEMGIPSVATGRTVLVVPFMGSVETQPPIVAVAVKAGHAPVLLKPRHQVHRQLLRLQMRDLSILLVRLAYQLCMQV